MRRTDVYIQKSGKMYKKYNYIEDFYGGMQQHVILAPFLVKYIN